jgi:LacI family transcriptional regulator
VQDAVERDGMVLRTHRYPWNQVPQRFETDSQTVGMLIIPPSYLNGAALAAIEAVRVPLVLLDSIPHGLHLHGVGSDNAYGGALAADHLLGQGLERLAVISAEPAMNPNVGARIRGFQRQCKISGVRAPRLIGGHSPLGVSGSDTAYSLMRQVLAEGPLDFNGIFADSATTAMGAMKACRDAGVVIPDDLALVAFDDTPEARFMQPTISVLKQDVAAWATEALAIIAEEADTGRDHLPRHIQIAPRLLVRESSRVVVQAADFSA